MSTIFDVKANPQKAYASFAGLAVLLIAFPFVAQHFGNQECPQARELANDRFNHRSKLRRSKQASQISTNSQERDITKIKQTRKTNHNI